eukprot:8203974-Pyramimonas_sp.AAC.1
MGDVSQDLPERPTRATTAPQEELQSHPHLPSPFMPWQDPTVPRDTEPQQISPNSDDIDLVSL